MSNRLDLFDNYEWLGQFWPPNSDQTFSGILKYNPTHGVQLKYLILPNEFPWEADHLHGVLEGGEECTLFVKFSNSGDFSTVTGTTAVNCCAVGAHISPSTTFQKILFNLTSLQEFFASEHPGRQIPFSPDEKFKYSEKGIEVCVISEGTFERVDSDFANHFHTEDHETLDKIRRFFNDLKPKNFWRGIGFSKDRFEMLSVSKAGGIGLSEGIGYTNTFYHLFSLLLFRPVRPTEINAIYIDGTIKTRISILKKVDGLDDKNIQLLKQPPHHNEISIKPSELSLPNVFKTWLETKHKYDSFAPKLANTFRTYRAHEVKANIIMLLAQLEGINSFHKRKYGERYDFPINHYDKSSVLDTLAQLLKTNSTEVGSKLSDLRGELAHTGRGGIKILEQIPAFWLVGISICLDITIASHIFESMDIATSTIKKFQEKELEWPREFLQSTQ